MNLVTGVISSFNQAQYLEDAVLSLVHQVDELIVVDDNSTDSSPKILRNLHKKFKNLKVIQNSANIGVSKGVDKAIRSAVGEIILIQAADDISNQSRRLSQEAILSSHHTIVLSFCDPVLIDDAGSFITDLQLANRFKNAKGVSDYTKDLFMGTNKICAPSVAFRKEDYIKVGGFRFNVEYMQDLFLWLRFSLIGDFHNNESSFLSYRIHEKNLSKSTDDDQDEVSLRRKAEFSFELNTFIDSLSPLQVRDLFKKLNINYHEKVSIELNKIQLKRIPNNHLLKLIVLFDCLKLSDTENEFEYQILRQIIEGVSFQIR